MSIVQENASDIKIELLELVTPAETFDLRKLFVSMNIYEEYIVDEYMDNDEISDAEEGFMKGYLAAYGNKNVANKN